MALKHTFVGTGIDDDQATGKRNNCIWTKTGLNEVRLFFRLKKGQCTLALRTRRAFQVVFHLGSALSRARSGGTDTTSRFLFNYWKRLYMSTLVFNLAKCKFHTGLQWHNT